MEGSFFKAKTDFGEKSLRNKYRKLHEKCERCGNSSIIMEVHHIVRAQANKKIESFANYLVLCHHCHFDLHDLNWWAGTKEGLEIKFKS